MTSRRRLTTAVAAAVAVAELLAGTGIGDAQATTAGYSATRYDATSPHGKRAAMNLSQIARGDYGSLRGHWVEAAYGANCMCGRGVQWHRGGSDKLSVSPSRLVNGRIVVHKKTLSDGQGLTNAELVFVRRKKYEEADLADQSVAINYSVSFYPRGVAAALAFNNGVRVPSTANRIEVWSSNNGYTELFVQK